MLKKIVFLSCLLFLLSCDDGDLQVKTINFDDSVIAYCGTATPLTTIFFKINNDQALILKLQQGLLKNQASEDTIISNVPAQSQVTYRIFSDKVTNNYFCDEVPPIEPVVLQEIPAEGGQVRIMTTEVDSLTYEHNIALRNISLVDDAGHRITDLRINKFGDVTTRTLQ